MWFFLQRLSSLQYFYTLTKRLIPWIGWSCLLIMLIGLYWALFVAPPDYKQGEAYRIIYVHVPVAIMSMFVYILMAIAGGIGFIWRIKSAEVIATCSAPIGASFAFLALATGSLWGKPTWGTWWAWDVRLTSELILFFLYLGVIALNNAIEDKRTASQASAILTLVGLVDIPIIHFSVIWWKTVHQPPTLTKFSAPSMHTTMQTPLLIMIVAFILLYLLVLLWRIRGEILIRERNASWVQTLIEK